jgi:nitrogenase molybdenum-iron protein NifN
VLREQRARLIDACLDSHFWFSGKRIAIASDPDLLYSLSQLLSSMGAQIVSAVSSTGRSAILARVAAEHVLVSDLDDFEDQAQQQRADLLVTHSHGRTAAENLGIPLFRVGFSLFDRVAFTSAAG